MFTARRALHAKSHRSRYTGFYIAAVLFLLLQDFLLRPVLNFSPRGTRAFTVFSLFCNEKIAAPRRTRVTNATKICRTSLVARYAAPPCVTRQHILPVRYKLFTGTNYYLHYGQIVIMIRGQSGQSPELRNPNIQY